MHISSFVFMVVFVLTTLFPVPGLKSLTCDQFVHVLVLFSRFFAAVLVHKDFVHNKSILKLYSFQYLLV